MNMKRSCPETWEHFLLVSTEALRALSPDSTPSLYYYTQNSESSDESVRLHVTCGKSTDTDTFIKMNQPTNDNDLKRDVTAINLA